MQAIVDISNAQNIGGWMSIRELLWLAEMATKYDKIVEFGSFHGRSTRALADNINPNGIIWAVDPWNGDYQTESGDILTDVNTYVYPYFKHNLRDHITAGRVIPVRGFSFTFTLPHLVDMVFIDGDHTEKTVRKDIDKALSLVRQGGIISGHDYAHPLWTGVKKVVDEKFGSINVEDTIWWTVKS